MCEVISSNERWLGGRIVSLFKSNNVREYAEQISKYPARNSSSVEHCHGAYCGCHKNVHKVWLSIRTLRGKLDQDSVKLLTAAAAAVGQFCGLLPAEKDGLFSPSSNHRMMDAQSKG